MLYHIQSGTGAPHSKVRPERLTEKVPAMPVKFISIEQPCLLVIGYSPASRDPAKRDGILDIEIGC